MNILYIVPYVPSLVRVRPYHLIRTLAARGHHVSVVALGVGEQDSSDAENLRNYCHKLWYFEQPKWVSLLNSIIALPTSQPLQTVYSWQKKTARQINDRINKQVDGSHFDIIHVEHLRGSRYGTFLKTNQKKTPIVFDSVDCISYLFEQASGHSQSLTGRLITNLELNRTRKYEARVPHYFDHVMVTSPVDLEALKSLAYPGDATAPFSILPNGVDLDYFTPDPEIQKEESTIVFSGKMSYHANITMALYLVSVIMPYIWEVQPNTKLYIVGKDPSSEIKALARDPRIIVTGTVYDLRPYLWKALVAVVPLVYGAGIQNKLLEAMACGLPVVATPRATLPLTAIPGEDLLVAENPLEFANAVLQLFSSPGRRQEVALAGLNYVKNHHNWWNVGAKLENIYVETINQQNRSS